MATIVPRALPAKTRASYSGHPGIAHLVSQQSPSKAVNDFESIEIKDYQIHLPPLGRGAYGVVLRATYRGISERALKVFQPGAVDLVAMARELEKLSSVAEHQGIVTLHDFDLLNNPPYYSMGLHADQNEEDIWETRTLERLCGTVDHREAWRLLQETADALSYLHQHQIIHCDIKPSNILLTDEIPHHIKVCDFGQSRGLAAEQFAVAGTPLYASPEQLRNPSESANGAGFRWDVYSFGVLAYKLYTGKLPRLQDISEVDPLSVDLDATLHETALGPSLNEGTAQIDVAQIATLTEAVEDISWPTNLYIPTARKELITECLSLNPEDRPADMREVYLRMQHADQQRQVRRARQLSTLFATLLVVAIWACGFAFVQARKAQEAVQVAEQVSEESEQHAGAAMDMMLLFVNELNRGNLSSEEANRLSAVIAENSETFLENRSQNRRASNRILRFSAQTAALKGRQAQGRGDLDVALAQFQTAYEIRSELLADTTFRDRELANLASRDLVSIGRIHEEQEDFIEASEAYSTSLSIVTPTFDFDNLVEISRLRNLAGIYSAHARVLVQLGQVEEAQEVLQSGLEIMNRQEAMASEEARISYTIEGIRLQELSATVQLESELPEPALKTYGSILEVIENIELESVSPTNRDLIITSKLTALRGSGIANVSLAQLDEALDDFREQIRLLEELRSRRPYDADVNVSLSEAYANASSCLDPELNSSRALSVYYLEQAISLLNRLPTDVREESEIVSSLMAQFTTQLEEAQALQE